MQVPARFIRFATSYRGTASAEGFVEIDIKALDLDGVSKLYVDLSDVARLREKRDAAARTVDAWDALLSRRGEAKGEPSE
jgi:hypothetical protein